jgi:hypothetical protein
VIIMLYREKRLDLLFHIEGCGETKVDTTNLINNLKSFWVPYWLICYCLVNGLYYHGLESYPRLENLEFWFFKKIGGVPSEERRLQFLWRFVHGCKKPSFFHLCIIISCDNKVEKNKLKSDHIVLGWLYKYLSKFSYTN